jgi:hypothetical protein
VGLCAGGADAYVRQRPPREERDVRAAARIERRAHGDQLPRRLRTPLAETLQDLRAPQRTPDSMRRGRRVENTLRATHARATRGRRARGAARGSTAVCERRNDETREEMRASPGAPTWEHGDGWRFCLSNGMPRRYLRRRRRFVRERPCCRSISAHRCAGVCACLREGVYSLTTSAVCKGQLMGEGCSEGRGPESGRGMRGPRRWRKQRIKLVENDRLQVLEPARALPRRNVAAGSAPAAHQPPQIRRPSTPARSTASNVRVCKRADV